MKKTTILVLAIVACVAAIAQSAAVSRARSSHAKKLTMSASGNDVGQMMSKWLPALMTKRFHPGPDPDEEHVLPSKRKQVIELLDMTRTRITQSFK